MVKKWIIIIFIVALLGVSCVLENNYINNSFMFIEEKLLGFKTTIEKLDEENIDSNTNVEYIENLHEQWHGKLKGLKCLIWHSGIKDVEVGLSRIKTYTKENDKTETLAEINSLIDYIQHYSEDFTISIENIL